MTQRTYITGVPDRLSARFTFLTDEALARYMAWLQHETPHQEFIVGQDIEVHGDMIMQPGEKFVMDGYPEPVEDEDTDE